MKALLVLVAALAGVGSALESGSNATLRKALGAPLWTVALVSVVSVVAAVSVAAVAGGAPPTRMQLGQTPWWSWLGGLFGVVFLLATVFASPKLGAGLFVALIVTASTLMSLVLDNFGWMSFDVHRAGIGRIAGALLMIAGVGCIAAF